MTTFYSVTYDNNGSTSGSTPPTQVAESKNGTYTFTAQQQGDLLKTRYNFLGWSNNPNATTAQYAPGSTITLSSTSPKTTLYAVWKTLTMLDITNMNELTSAVCGNSSENTSKSLKDTSSGNGGNSYRVTKLKDGNCWMTQNMNNSTNRAYQHSTYGGYYTNQGSGSTDGMIMTGGNAISICNQMGVDWKLPTRNQYTTLVNGLSYSTITSSPYFFQPGGRFDNNNLQSANSEGRYWSSTSNGNGYYGIQAYSLYFTSNSIDASSAAAGMVGYSVRCLVQGS